MLGGTVRENGMFVLVCTCIHVHVLWTEGIDWGKVRTYTYNVHWHTREEREGGGGEGEREEGGGGSGGQSNKGKAVRMRGTHTCMHIYSWTT